MICATAGEGEANLPAMWFHLVSLESVKQGQNNGIKRGDNERLESQVLRFANLKALLHVAYIGCA